MKKAVNRKVLEKEAAYWERMKKVMDRPGTACRK